MLGLRPAALVAAAVLLVGCGSDTDPAPDPEAASDGATTASTSETTTSADETSQPPTKPLCQAINRKALAKIFGVQHAFAPQEAGSSLGLPSYDACRILVGGENAGVAVTYAWSIESVDASRWAEIRKYQQDTNGRYIEIEDIKVGDGGYFYLRTAAAKVGDRVLRVSYGGAGAERAQMVKALELAVPHAGDLPESPLTVTLPECEALDAEAEAVLGASPTIRRDRQGDYGVTCGWATSDAAVTISAARLGGAKRLLSEDIAAFGGKKIPDLGELAAYFGGVDGRGVDFIVHGDLKVHVSVPPAMPGEEQALVALAKKAAPLYR